MEHELEHIASCIVCGSTNSIDFIKCKDFTVSGLTFNIVQCQECEFKFTSPRPAVRFLGSFYKSEKYVSHNDSNKGFINKLYQFVKNYTLLQKLKLVLKYNRKGRLLDYGCGTGSFGFVCKKAGWDFYGVEPDTDAGEVARNKTGGPIYSSSQELSKAFPDSKFDAITLWHVLEHIPDVPSWFNFISNHLEKSGTLIIAVPNCDSYDASIFKAYWAAYDVPRHLWHFTPKTIEKLFLNNGFKLIETRPMIFDSFYVSLLSNTNKFGRSRPLLSFLQGLLSNLKANKSGLIFSSQIYIFKKSI